MCDMERAIGFVTIGFIFGVCDMCVVCVYMCIVTCVFLLIGLCVAVCYFFLHSSLCQAAA